MITQKWLLEFTTYRNGELWWKTKFTNACRMDKPIGCDNGRGYLICRISGKSYKVHRLIWLYHYGKWPDGDYFSYVGFEEVMKEAWDASRQNMTTRDI